MPADFLNFLPEVTVLLSALVIFVLATATNSARLTWRVGALLSVAVVGVSIWGLGLRGEPFFPGIYTVDAFSQILKLGLALGLLGVMMLGGLLGSFRPTAHVDTPIFLLLATAAAAPFAPLPDVLLARIASWDSPMATSANNSASGAVRVRK